MRWWGRPMRLGGVYKRPFFSRSLILPDGSVHHVVEDTADRSVYACERTCQALKLPHGMFNFLGSDTYDIPVLTFWNAVDGEDVTAVGPRRRLEVGEPVQVYSISIKDIDPPSDGVS